MTEHRGPGIHRPGTGAQHCFALVPFGISIEERSSSNRERLNLGCWSGATMKGARRRRRRRGRDRREPRERDEMDEG